MVGKIEIDIVDMCEKLVGFKYSEIEKFKFIRYRIVKEDGKGKIITADLRSDRINLEIQNGIIVKAYMG